MKAGRAGGLVDIGHDLMLLACPGFVGRHNLPDINTFIEDQLAKDAFYNALSIVRGSCEHLGLTVTLNRVDRIEKRAQEMGLKWSQVEADANSICQSLTDELESYLFLCVEPALSVYYNQPTKGWSDCLQAFPSTELDVEEAAKCLALNRFTAVVFHLMRVMEIGLRVLGETLNDPRLDPKTNPTWARILQRCQEEQAKPLAQRSDEWRSSEAFYSGVSARLMAVKDAWRNPTMHVEITYTEETSMDVYNHVQAFMRHLATKLSE